MILSAKLHVRHDNGDLHAGNSQNDKHNKKEAHHVVILMQPKSAHDEKELDGDGSKGQNSTDDGTPGKSRVPLLFRNETRNVIGFGGNLDSFCTETKVAANKDKRCGNAGPQEKDGYNGENRY
mmetsp:Transcript_33391/g.44544  ORF Transcript_33391/g.44544 Transcript_33391/m.44544 type:complete len:123 (+) Transcript_33391:232-600(+)